MRGGREQVKCAAYVCAAWKTEQGGGRTGKEGRETREGEGIGDMESEGG